MRQRARLAVPVQLHNGLRGARVRKVIVLLAVVAAVVALVSGGKTTGNDGPVAGGHDTITPATERRHQHGVMRYTVAERVLIDSVDVAAGKAMQATASPDGVYEQRTSREWCG